MNTLIDNNLINNNLLDGKIDKSEKDPFYKNGKDLLADVNILEFSSNNQKMSFDVPEGCWLNFIDDEKFLFLPGIIVISADSSHLKTWLAQSVAVNALKKNGGHIRKIYHLDFDNTMATYKQRKISPINFEYIGMDGRKYNKKLTSIADDMEALSDQGCYQYMDYRQLASLCEQYDVDDISPYEVLQSLIKSPDKYISSGLFIIDVLSNFESDVNNADKAAKFMRLLRRLCNRGCGAIFIVLHHNNKQKDENGKSVFQGANIWLTQSDQLYQQERISEHSDQVATIVLRKTKDKNGFLNGDNGIVFYLDKSKRLAEALNLGIYIEDEEIINGLNDYKKELFNKIMTMLKDNSNGLTKTEIVKRLDPPKDIKIDSFKMSVYRFLTDVMVKNNYLICRKDKGTSRFSIKKEVKTNVDNAENINSNHNSIRM